MGVLLALLLCYGFIWAYKAPSKPGEKPMELHTLLVGVGAVLAGAAGWQWLRYMTFKGDVTKGVLVSGSGPPSMLLAFIKGLFVSSTVHTGSRGGKYTVDYKGSKRYKHRG